MPNWWNASGWTPRDNRISTFVSQQVTAGSGVGVDVRSNNNPVTAVNTGDVQVEDHGAYSENAIGVQAVSAPGGRSI